jgi:hypothetical protein
MRSEPTKVAAGGGIDFKELSPTIRSSAECESRAFYRTEGEELRDDGSAFEYLDGLPLRRLESFSLNVTDALFLSAARIRLSSTADQSSSSEHHIVGAKD